MLLSRPQKPYVKSGESPVFSPDIGSGSLFLESTRNRSWFGEKRASFALASKPGTCPESRDSPRITPRQEIVNRKSGVCFSGFASHERASRTKPKVIRGSQRRQA